MKTNFAISPQVIYILLSLYIKERHGYEIMKEVQRYSEGKITMGPGTLYGAVKKLLDENLIEASKETNERRKYYKLTNKGRSLLSSEVEKLNKIVSVAKLANLKFEVLNG